MNSKKYQRIRTMVVLFIGAVAVFGVIQESYILVVISVLIGMLFLILVRSKTKIRIDEREKTIREKASQMTYAVFAPTIGIGAFLLLIPYKDISPVFANGEFIYLESLGMILAYLTLFLIALYAVSYFYLNWKYGGGRGEE